MIGAGTHKIITSIKTEIIPLIRKKSEVLMHVPSALGSVYCSQKWDNGRHATEMVAMTATKYPKIMDIAKYNDQRRLNIRR